MFKLCFGEVACDKLKQGVNYNLKLALKRSYIFVILLCVKIVVLCMQTVRCIHLPGLRN